MSAFLKSSAPYPVGGEDHHLRPAHSSSRNNNDYRPIETDMLLSMDIRLVNMFRAFITSMSPTVSFDSTLKLPFDGSSLTTEADVTTYLETQVIISAWQVVLQMVPPTDRMYDLMTMRQMYLAVRVVFQSNIYPLYYCCF